MGIRGSGVRCVSHGQVYLTRLAGWLVKAEKSLAWGKEVALSPVWRRNQRQGMRLCKTDS